MDAAYTARVRKALASQSSLLGKAERCSADPDKLATIGRAMGNQIRVIRNDHEYAVYTVKDVREEPADSVIRMAQAARARLGTAGEFIGTVVAQVPHPTYTDQEAEAYGDFVERLQDADNPSALVAIAPHGGQIERYTDLQAERVQQRLSLGVAVWQCKGWKPGGGAFERWHITSTEIHEASFPHLQMIIDRKFTYGVAFHGFDESGILIGGAAPDALKQEIRSAIEAAVEGSPIAVRIADSDDHYDGDAPENLVNRLCCQNGVQIEQSSQARLAYWQAIADAVVSVYRSKI